MRLGDRSKVNVDVIFGVMPGNVTGQHPGIRCPRFRADQRDLQTRHGIHPEHPQHDDVAVSAPDQDQVASDGLIVHASGNPGLDEVGNLRDGRLAFGDTGCQHLEHVRHFRKDVELCFTARLANAIDEQFQGQKVDKASLLRWIQSEDGSVATPHAQRSPKPRS